MKKEHEKWSKTELQLYILLACANADNKETEEELAMIQSKVPKETFDKLYELFKGDSEKKQLKRISRNIHLHNYSFSELSGFRREMYEIYFSDCNFTMMEKRLDWTLDNILY
ncbi:hypothetical protein [Ulvibacter antarcticus]|uniref:Tellurite resistance protein TerB n=1 Tax=Ulvibacter antarcticus TaxID=442714 RepID=A0A3L9YDG8_9FLAO|nr:hypothetical protein [Ulvibacter antarcticus]RMA58701.1 hypothetical protein BXY75_2078 [Ulvibacter antarcticus]